MNMTKQWLNKQIQDYTHLLNTLFVDPNMKEVDEKVKPIWQATLNTLQTTLRVLELETGI